MPSPGFELAGPYHGYTTLPGTDADFYVQFSVGDMAHVASMFPPGISQVTPLEIAEAINGVLVSHGWDPIQYFGKPPEEFLNELAA